MNKDEDIPEVEIRRFSGGITSFVFAEGREPRFKAVLTPPMGYRLIVPADFSSIEPLSDTSSWSQFRKDGTPTGAMIYVNWVHLPQVPAQVQYDLNRQQIQREMDSPHPQYCDLQEFDRAQGYAWDGPAFWFKEVDKDDPSDIHRWHIKAFGNGSQYTVGLTGQFGQFEKLAPLYEETVRAFKRIPFPNE